MITNSINQQIMAAMKARDAVRLSTLRMLSAALHNYQIDHPQMNEEEELGVVKKEAKKRRDAIEAYQKAGATERADKEKKELTILQEFLPPEMPEAEVEKLVVEAIAATHAQSPADMGKVIGAVLARAKGAVDGARVSAIAKAKLT